jgi:capsular exopolysaccharide synthesis family protein
MSALKTIASESENQLAPLVSKVFGVTVAESMNLRETANLLRRRASLIVSVFLVFVFLSLLVAVMLTPQYKAETILMLDQRQKELSHQNATTPTAAPVDNASLRSELDIITSRSVIDRVVKKLRLSEDPEFQAWRESWTRGLNPVNWFKADRPMTKEEAEALRQSKVANAVAQRLKATNDGRSFSIKISFESSDPAKAAQIVNSFADEYLVDQLEARYETTARANSWLSDRLSSLRKQVEITEKAVEDFRQKNRLIEVDGSTVVSRQMDEINSQLTEARAGTSAAEARLRSTQQMVRENGGYEAAADVLSSPLIQRLREQEAELRRTEADLMTRYGERHPKLIKAHAEIEDLQKKIGEEVQKIIRSLANEVTVARAKESQMRSDLQSLESRAGSELRSSVQLRQLQREADANRTLYESFLKRFKQTSEEQDLKMADSRIIARAEPPVEAAFPKVSVFAFAGGLIGLFFGFLAAYMVEYFDRGFRNGTQLEEKTGLPTIGIIPSLRRMTKQKPEDYVVAKPLSAYSEALRTVRTAIHFSNVDHPPKTVLVTSAAPSEGKTTFCLSLARSLAKAGNKVLLIDADLRRPRLARIMNFKMRIGLSSLLAGAKKFEEVVQKDPSVKGLDVIPAFGKTPNPQDLLGSARMRKLIQEVSPNYDLVLIDTPPILAVSDAAMAARAADTAIFVVRWAETPRETVFQALKQLNSFNCRVAGCVLTQVDLDNMAGYGDGSYNYRYHAYYTN